MTARDRSRDPDAVRHYANSLRAGDRNLQRHQQTGFHYSPLQASREVREMGTAESAFETGQFFFAASASVRNDSTPSPSTRASRSSAIEVIANPSPTFEMSTAAVTL